MGSLGKRAEKKCLFHKSSFLTGFQGYKNIYLFVKIFFYFMVFLIGFWSDTSKAVNNIFKHIQKKWGPNPTDYLDQAGNRIAIMDWGISLQFLDSKVSILIAPTVLGLLL